MPRSGLLSGSSGCQLPLILAMVMGIRHIHEHPQWAGASPTGSLPHAHSFSSPFTVLPPSPFASLSPEVHCAKGLFPSLEVYCQSHFQDWSFRKGSVHHVCFFNCLFLQNFEGYFPLIVFSKCWLCSPWCTIRPRICLIPSSLHLPLSHPYIPPTTTTGYRQLLPYICESTSFYYIHQLVVFFRCHIYMISYSNYLSPSDLFHIA